MAYYPPVIGSVSAGTTRALGPEIVLSNSNGISFGVAGSTVTAQHNALTSQSNQAVSAANGSFAFQTLVLSNLNGMSFGTDAGSVVTGSYTVPAVPPETPFGISAGTQSVSTGTLVFSNSNGITFGMSGSSRVTASHDGLTSQSNQAASASNGSFAFQTLAFSNANNVTFGTSAGSIITASVAAGGGGLTNINLSAGTTSQNLSNFVMSNSNGVSFGLNGSTVTGSVATSLTNINVSAGTTSNNLSNLVFSGSNGISFGLNGSTVTARNLQLSYWDQPTWHSSNTIANGTLSVQRVFVPNRLDATRLDMIIAISGSSSGAASFSFVGGIYTMSGSTASLASSFSRGITYQSTSAHSYTNYSGTRYHSFGAAWNVTPGEYLFALVIASTSASTNSTIRPFGNSAISIVANSTAGANFSEYFGMGYLSAATSNVPASMHLSDIRQTGNLVGFQPYFRLVGTF